LLAIRPVRESADCVLVRVTYRAAFNERESLHSIL
jgi:hypothetical protein